MVFKEMTDNQRRVFIDTIQLYEAFSAAFNKMRSYKGGMHWKKSKGREYLFRLDIPLKSATNSAPFRPPIPE